MSINYQRIRETGKKLACTDGGYTENFDLWNTTMHDLYKDMPACITSLNNLVLQKKSYALFPTIIWKGRTYTMKSASFNNLNDALKYIDEQTVIMQFFYVDDIYGTRIFYVRGARI